ncbi:MAG: hypothetical protein WAT21_04075 [Saprospiraceae bacterium]
MYKTILKISLWMSLMIAFLIIAFRTNDAINGQVFASLGIITGGFFLKFISNPKLSK